MDRKESIKSRGSWRRRGASVVEMAVISPILITLIFGIIEFGWAFMVRQMVTSAAREGARLSAIQTTVDDEEIRDTVKSSLESIPNLTVENDDIAIEHWGCEPDSTDFTESVTVTVAYDDISLLGNFFSWIEFNDLVGTSAMRKEGVDCSSVPPGESSACSQCP